MVIARGHLFRWGWVGGEGSLSMFAASEALETRSGVLA
jgi:hypothetical protein